MSEAVLDILHRIEALPEPDRLLLQEHLARAAEAEWLREAEEARRLASDETGRQRTRTHRTGPSRD